MKNKYLKRTLTLILSIAMIIGTISINGSIKSEAATSTTITTFAPRLTEQSADNKYYYSASYNPYIPKYGLPNCVAYAYARAYEILGTKPLMSQIGSAYTWFGYNASKKNYEYGTTPRVGAIACWYYKPKPTEGGHVAVVEQVNEDGSFVISESQSKNRETSPVYFRTRTLKNAAAYSSSYAFQGFFYLLGKDVTVVDPIEDEGITKTQIFYGLEEEEVVDPEEDIIDSEEEVKEPEYVDDPTIPTVSVSYRTHVQTSGWQKEVKDGEVSGTVGKAKRLEGIEINVSGNENVGIQYTTHVQTYGWQSWSKNGDMSGTEGEAKRLEAIKIKLTGTDKDLYDVYYRVHAQTYGWMGWAKNGEPAGTAGYAKRLEGIQIVVVKKGAPAPSSDDQLTEEAYVEAKASQTEVDGDEVTNVAYKTHVQTYGWQGWKYNGAMSGTSGEAKRLEGINIKLTNKQYAGGIQYKTHIQTYGWEEEWSKDGEMSGTSGEAKRLEAIQIELTGEMAEHYDVYYRVHAQTYGWLDWAKNGEKAGTAGYAKRLEAIEIVLVEKGGEAPGKTDKPFVEAE